MQGRGAQWRFNGPCVLGPFNQEHFVRTCVSPKVISGLLALVKDQVHDNKRQKDRIGANIGGLRGLPETAES